MDTITITEPPKSGKAVTQPTGGIIAQIKAVLANGVSQETVSKEAGVSNATLSLYLNNKYNASTKTIEATLQKWLERREEAEAMRGVLPEDPPYYETPTSAKIIPVFQYAQMRGSMGLVVGGAGCSKTQTALNYQANSNRVWTAMATPATARFSSFLALIADEMDISVQSNKPALLEQAIVKHLRGTRGLLIVDEAQYLPVETLYELTMIRERSRVGIVLMGNEAIYGRVQAGYAQLYSRFGKRLRLTGVLQGDLDACLRAWEVQQQLKKGTLGGEIAKNLWGTKQPGPAREDGGLRNVSECLALAFFMANGVGEAIDIKHVKAAWKDIGVA